MQRALQLIVIYGFQLSELQYPVDITACRILFSFSKLLWDDAHRVSGAIGAGLPNRDPAASIVAQGNFYGTDVLRKE